MEAREALWTAVTCPVFYPHLFAACSGAPTARQLSAQGDASFSELALGFADDKRREAMTMQGEKESRRIQKRR